MTKEDVYKIMDLEEGTISYENAEYMICEEGYTPDMLLAAYKKLGPFWAFCQ